MADLKTKIQALRAVLGDDQLVADILTKAGNSEKELLEAGVEFKEADVPGDEAGAGDPIEEDAGADLPEGGDLAEEKAKLEDPEEEAEGEESEEIMLVDLTVDEFAGILAAALDEVFGPYFDQLDNMSAPQPAPAQAAASKEIDAEVDELRTQLAAVTAERDRLAQESTTVKEILERIPRHYKPAGEGYRASESDDTVLKEDDPMLMKAPRADDGWNFADFVLAGKTANNGNGR